MHLAEGQFLIEGLKLNIEVSEIPSRDLKTDSFQKGGAVFQTTVNLDKEQCINVIPPLT
jgi:hypothetical protein